MSRVQEWLTSEIRADIDELRGYGPLDFVRAGADTVFAPGLIARTTAYACVYAINHAERGAVTSYSLFSPPIQADAWRQRDEIQAGTLAALPIGLFATPVASVPHEPVVAIVVAQQLGVLAASPLLAIINASG